MRLKWLSLLLMLVLLAGLLPGCSSTDTVKIGFVVQLTGPDSYVGQYAKMALEDRVEEINKAGGIEGHKIELIAYDSRSQIPDAVAAKRLIDQDKSSR